MYQVFHPGLLRFAYQLSGDPQLAFDAAQDAWLSTIKALRRLHDPRAFASWLFRATKWRVRDLQRSNARFELTEPGDLSGSVDLEQVTQDSFGQLIEQLPLLQKQLLLLFYQQGFSLQEIALIQEVPLGTVKSRLNRARNTLKQQWEQQDEY